MSHYGGPSVYRRHYMPPSVDFDCQAIYFGTPRQDELAKRVSALRRDSRAPKRLQQQLDLNYDKEPQVLYFKQGRETAYLRMKDPRLSSKRQYWEEKYQRAKSNLQNTKVKLREAHRKMTRDEFWKNIDYIDCERQLNGVFDANEQLMPISRFELGGRYTLANLFLIPTANLVEWQL